MLNFSNTGMECSMFKRKSNLTIKNISGATRRWSSILDPLFGANNIIFLILKLSVFFQKVTVNICTGWSYIET